MTIRNFDALFSPRSVALVGASNQPGSVGAVLARNLYQGGFDGPIMSVNPHEEAIHGTVAYQDISKLPVAPDLAVIATPAPTIPGIVANLSSRGTRGVVVISTGFGKDQTGQGARLRQEMLDAARPTLTRVIGPNCLGLISPHRGLNASFAHASPRTGALALVTQSGAIATSMLDWAIGREIGFSQIVSLGDMADVDFGDMLDFLAQDKETRAILLYVEAISNARKFLSAGRIAARAKPVIVLKGGRSRFGAAAAASHTGALAGSDLVYEAAFRRAGMLQVETLADLLNAAETLAHGVHVTGDRLTIITNGGGLGVIAADALERVGGHLAPLSEQARATLDAALPNTWSHTNPIDILGDAGADKFSAAINAVRAQDNQDALLVLACPTGVSDFAGAAAGVAQASSQIGAPMFAAWVGGASAEAPRAMLARARIPTYATPEAAVAAFAQLVEYGRNQRALLEVPTASEAIAESARAKAKSIIADALADGRVLLTEVEAKAVLTAYRVPTVETKIVKTPAEAGQVARAFAVPIALKILSRDISHKTDVGGVRLDLETAAETETAANAMLERVKRAAPEARIDGFTVQPMIRRPRAHELIVGANVDPTFGPTVLFGAGGVAVEVLADRIIGLAPLNAALALDMIKRTRVQRLLAGYRDRPPANLTAIAHTIAAVSELACDCPEIASLDINPLLADDSGVIALDARIVLTAPDAKAALVRPAIEPFPRHLVGALTTAGGDSYALRPIRPEDAAALVAFGEQCYPDHLRLRFHGSLGHMTVENAARLTQIDYDREMAFLALEADDPIAIVGIVRVVFDPDFTNAEYAIIVRSDKQERGLGHALMRRMLDYARTRGVKSVWGDILVENRGMIDLAKDCGAELGTPECGVLRSTIALT